MAYGEDHKANIDVIGGTNATGRGRAEVAWNHYYFETYKSVCRAMLAGVPRGSVLDVGTSHGNWFSFFKAEGFKLIYGVEISAERAAEARSVGYTDVFNCDATSTPLPENSLDAAVSNDVLVHVLKSDDKRAIFKRVAALLRPGGVFVFNHTSAEAYGRNGYFVQDHCSFATRADILEMVGDSLALEAVAPSYFNFRNQSPPLWLKAMRRGVALPGVTDLLRIADKHWTVKHLDPEQSDAIYYRFRKPR